MAKTFVPHDYQQSIISHICERERAGVWAPMGGGKSGSTLFSLEALDAVADPYPALILAPLRVANGTWPDEVAKWSNFEHLRVSAIAARRNPETSATPKERLAALNVRAEVFTLPYDNLAWLKEALDGKWPFRSVISDEWTRLKSFRIRQGGARAQALRKMMTFANGERFIGLTGTPAPNGLQDLWGQLFYIDQGERLGRTYTAFEQRWFRPSENGYGLVPFEHTQREIEALIRDVCLTVEGLPVDEPIENIILVDLPPKAMSYYREMEREAFVAIEREGLGRIGDALNRGDDVSIEAVNGAVKVNKCLQIANGFIFHEGGKVWETLHNTKMEALESVMEEANGMPVLASYTYVPVKEAILHHFKKAKALDADPETVARWNRGAYPLLAAHPASCGHGLNMQDGGNILTDVGLTWNLEHDMQILERIGPLRQLQSGYDRPVFRHRIVARNTLEQKVTLPRLQTKRSTQELILEAMKRRRT